MANARFTPEEIAPAQWQKLSHPHRYVCETEGCVTEQGMDSPADWEISWRESGFGLLGEETANCSRFVCEDCVKAQHLDEKHPDAEWYSAKPEATP